MKNARARSLVVVLAMVAPFAARAANAVPPPLFPYALDPVLDGSLVAGGLAVYGGSLYLQTLKPAPDKAAIDPSAIPFFDRAYPSAPSAVLSNAGSDLALGMAALPLILFPGRSGGEMLDIGVMYAETLELAYSVDSLLKSTIVRYRPYAYSTSTPADFSNSDISMSFPSSHATLAFSAAVFTGVVFDKLYPDSNLKPLVWASGLGLAVAVSTLRVMSGDHFLSDVVAGAAIGAASGFLLPFIHERTRAAAAGNGAVSSFKVEPTPGGFVATIGLAP
ncbi:MAG: phosphatase PAP2 family protein [Rectinemataceae bacterium]